MSSWILGLGMILGMDFSETTRGKAALACTWWNQVTRGSQTDFCCSGGGETWGSTACNGSRNHLANYNCSKTSGFFDHLLTSWGVCSSANSTVWGVCSSGRGAGIVVGGGLHDVARAVGGNSWVEYMVVPCWKGKTSKIRLVAARSITVIRSLEITFMQIFTIRDEGGWTGVGLQAWEMASWSPPARARGEHFVHPAIFSLHFLHFLYIFETINGTSEIDFPDRWVRLVSVLAAVDSPLTEECCVSLGTIPPFLGMYPRHSEDCLFVV